jgi:hypothetical protein
MFGGARRLAGSSRELCNVAAWVMAGKTRAQL